jgi:hypothetical protein
MMVSSWWMLSRIAYFGGIGIDQWVLGIGEV